MSPIKRIRSNETKKNRNKLQFKTTRNAIRDLKAETSKKKAQKSLPTVVAMIDKLAKKNIIHKNKAGNLKSKLTKFVAAI
jgi:small subunit ribosomal protein S20